MARPRTPTSVLEARGAFAHNPNRARPLEPQVTEPLGDCPETFSAAQAKAWREIKDGAPENVLTAADRMAVEVASILMAEFRSDPVEFKPPKLVRLCSLLGAFGMTPADRSRLSIQQPTKPAANIFGALDS